MIKIAFTGDIMLSRNVGKMLGELKPNDNIYCDDILNYLKNHDYVVGNLECPIAIKSSRKKKFLFKGKPETLHKIKEFNLLTLANNHIFDCGVEGALETQSFLLKNNFDYCGLLNDTNDKLYFLKEIKGKSIAFFSATTQENITINKKSLSRIVSVDNQIFYDEIKKLKPVVDFIFVIIHGDNEMISYPSPSFKEKCKKAIDCGADAVITHHPHVVGGFEKYKEGLIFYSLGDFIFDGESKYRRRGVILSIFFENKKIKFDLFPTCINNDLKVKNAETVIAKKILKKWRKVSEVIIKKNYHEKYRLLYINELVKFQISRVIFLLRSKGIISTFKFTFKKFYLIRFYIKKINNLMGK